MRAGLKRQRMNPLRKDYETLQLGRHDSHVLLVTLNRPEASNSMNTQMGRDLMELFEEFQIQFHDLRCIVVTGAGDKAFCAGGDLKERRGMTDEAWQTQHANFDRMGRAVMACPLPVVAAVNGAAYGGRGGVAGAGGCMYAGESGCGGLE